MSFKSKLSFSFGNLALLPTDDYNKERLYVLITEAIKSPFFTFKFTETWLIIFSTYDFALNNTTVLLPVDLKENKQVMHVDFSMNIVLNDEH